MLAAVAGIDRDEVTAAALLRLLSRVPPTTSGRRSSAAMTDPSPWVRAAAAEAAGDHLSPSPGGCAAQDDARSRALAACPRGQRPGGPFRQCGAEKLARGPRWPRPASWRLRYTGAPDDFASQYDLGRLHERRGDMSCAIAAYEAAIRLRPDMAARWSTCRSSTTLSARPVTPKRPSSGALPRARQRWPPSEPGHAAGRAWPPAGS